VTLKSASYVFVQKADAVAEYKNRNTEKIMLRRIGGEFDLFVCIKI
jgi:hypothetical protein